MSDHNFVALIEAQLDDTKLKQNMNDLLAKKYVIDVELGSQKATKSFVKGIEQGFKNAKIDLAPIAKNLANTFNIKDQAIVKKLKDEVNSMMKSVANTWDGQSFDAEKFDLTYGLDQIAATLKDNGKMLIESSHAYDEVYSYLSKQKILMTDDLKMSLGDEYKTFVRSNSKNFVTDPSKARPINEVWPELVSAFPNFFSDKMTHDDDQIRTVMDIIRAARKDKDKSLSMSDMTKKQRDMFSNEIQQALLSSIDSMFEVTEKNVREATDGLSMTGDIDIEVNKEQIINDILDAIREAVGKKTNAEVQMDVDEERIRSQIHNAVDEDIDLNIDDDLSEKMEPEAHKAGQRIGSIISKEAADSIKKVTSPGIGKFFTVDDESSDEFSNQMSKLVDDWTKGKGKLSDIKISTETLHDKDLDADIEVLKSAVVTYSNELGEVIQKTIKWRQIGSEVIGEDMTTPIYGFAEATSRYSKSLTEAADSAEKFEKTQKRVANQLSNKVKTDYTLAIDPNSSKPIKDKSHLDTLETKYNEINSEIAKLGSLSGSAFSDQENHINTLINDLKILVVQYRNAESTAAALRSKSIEVVRDETRQKIQGLKADIEKAGVASEKLTDYLSRIDKALENDEIDASSINEVLNWHDLSRAEVGKLKKEKSAAESLEKARIKASGLTSDINRVKAENLDLGSWTTEINGAVVSVDTLIDELANVKTAADVSVVTEKWKAFTSAAKQAGVMMEEVSDSAKKINDFTKVFNNGKYGADLKVAEQNLLLYEGQDSDALSRARQYVKEYEQVYSEIKNHFDSSKDFSLSTDQLIADINKLENASKKYQNAMREVKSEQTKTISAEKAITRSNDIVKYMNDNTRAMKKYGKQLQELADDMRQVTTQGRFNELDAQFKSLKSSISAEGLTGKSIFNELGRAATQIAEFTSIYGILQNVIEDVPRQMMGAVVEIDDSLTNLQMATGVSDTKAKELMNTYYDLGDVLKATATDVATSATEWLKQGKSIAEANQLVQDSIVLSKIGDLSSEDATSTITAAMKSYNLATDEVMGFVDQISAIDMASATDVGGLAAAFNEVAANAKQAGVETQNLLSYAAVIGETSQEGMASVGTALNAIFSRMGNIKLARLKDYESGEDLSNVELVLRKNGIALRDTVGEFREFDEVLAETASKYQSWNSVTQRAVAQAFAGTNHMNEFMILMKNWEQVEQYIATADNAAGQSMQKYEAYQDSITGKVEAFKNQFQETSATIISTDFAGGVVESGTAALEIVTQLIDKFGILQTIFAGAAGVLGAKGLGLNHSLQAPLYKVA